MKIPVILLAAAVLAAPAGFDPRRDFGYDRRRPLDLRVVSSQDKDGARVRDVTFASAAEGRTAAYLVSPGGKIRGRRPGVLFVHWLEPEAPDSNRTQFLEQARRLARLGVTSLLIETMWSDPGWFRKRQRSGDFAASLRQVRELRRALDVLAAQPGVDPRRLAYVGHDFGGMYGALLPSVERRVRAYAIQAATVSLSDWYLLGPPKLEGEARQRFVEELAPLDPVRFIGQAAPAPVLFQFARKDFYVPVPKAEQFFAAAGEPKKILWYEAGHGLNQQAVEDRIEWLQQVLGLK